MESGIPGPRRVGELLDVARAALDEALRADPGDLSDAGLGDRVRETVALAEQAEALAAATTGVWAARGVHREEGWGSARAWVVASCPVGTPGAGRLLGLGRFLQTFPATREAVRSGDVPVASARLMARVATGDRLGLFARDEAVLVDQAAHLTVDQFAVVLRRWAVLADDALADAEADGAHRRRRAHLSDVGNETKLDAAWGLADGAMVHAALDHAMGRPDPVDAPGGPRTLAQRRADALLDIVRAYAAGHDLGPVPAPTRVALSVRVDLDVLIGSSEDPFDPEWFADVFRVGPVGRSTLRRLFCDSAVSRVVTSGRHLPLDLGAATRLFGDAQRQAMVARDGDTCVVPGCTVPVDRCEAHHLDPYATGGATDLDNGAHLCGFHHHCVHEGGWELVRADGAWALRRRRGRGAARSELPDAA